MTHKKFIHHYLLDTIVTTFLLFGITFKVLRAGIENDWRVWLAICLAGLVAIASILFYWFVIRRIYINLMLAGYRTFDRLVIRHFEYRGVERWQSQHAKSLEEDAVYNGISESKRQELLAFAAEIYKAKELREQEMKTEAQKQLARVVNYTKRTLFMLNFSAEDIFKICNQVDLFVTTRSVIKSPTVIAKRDDVSVAELKNLVANITELYGIDNITAAQFISEVFKEWCCWADAQGKIQRTEVTTIAKTLRTTKGRLRVLPTRDIFDTHSSYQGKNSLFSCKTMI